MKSAEKTLRKADKLLLDVAFLMDQASIETDVENEFHHASNGSLRLANRIKELRKNNHCF